MTQRAAGLDPFVVETAAYRLELSRTGLAATLSSPAGEHWATLRPLAAFDTSTARDETLEVREPVALDGGHEYVLERRSTIWDRAAVRLRCTDDRIELIASVTGRGDVTDVALLGGRSLVPAQAGGFVPSGSSFRTLFSASPSDPGRLVQRATERAVLGVSGDDEPGRGHWFFTPAPLYVALTTDELDRPAESSAGWLGVSLTAPVQELGFVQLVYEPADRAFSFRLEYEGHTRVDGELAAPTLVLTPGLRDPYHGIAVHRDLAVDRGDASRSPRRERVDWWTEPVFCGWGAQCHLAAVDGGQPRDYATERNYDAFLAELEQHDVVPGTVVVDDKWQSAYGTATPDEGKWPDLAAWIAARHERGQHVLLWWKAWDPEGLADEVCVRTPDGRPVALDPTNPRALEVLRETIAALLASDGADADGLKVDFTARTPTGAALTTAGDGWGIALLHRLLAAVYEAAKEAKPDALVITHAPHPAFAEVTDMIRLNDMLRLRDRGPVPDVVAQMRHRAAIVRAACPDLPIDTDDWCAPDLASWRAYAEVKPELGVPALYYASHVDRTGERLTPDDYGALRRTWERWTSMQGTLGRR